MKKNSEKKMDNPEPAADIREAKPPEPAHRAARTIIPELAGIIAWCVPGLGHFYIGEKRKAVFFFLAIVLGYMFGALICSFECLSWEEHGCALIAQAGIGFLTIPIVFLKHVFSADTSPETLVNPLMDPGLLYTQVAGLLNFLVALDAFERGVRIHRERKKR